MKLSDLQQKFMHKKVREMLDIQVRKAPLFVGGGIAHGPKGNVYKVRRLNKKEKKQSLIAVISQKTKDKKLIIFEDIKEKINKTKEFNNFLKRNRINKALIVVDSISKKKY